MFKSTTRVFLYAFILFLLLPQTAHAYLDPGSGSYVIQIVIASIAGAGLLIKSQWHNIKNRFMQKKRVENKSEE